MSTLRYRAAARFDHAAEALQRAKEAEADRALVANIVHGGNNVAPLDSVVRVGELDDRGTAVPENDGHDFAGVRAPDRDVEDEAESLHACLADHSVKVRRVTIGKFELSLAVVKFTHNPIVGGAS